MFNRNPFFVYVLPSIALMMLLFMVVVLSSYKKIPKKNPTFDPPTSHFEKSIAGVGVVEAQGENIQISPPIAGLLMKFQVKVGDMLRKDQVICMLDDRDLKARYDAQKAALEMAKIELEDLQDQLKRYQTIRDKRAIRMRDLKELQFAVQKSRARIDQLKSEIALIQVQLNHLQVSSPIDGVVLKTNHREGEYIKVGDVIAIIGEIQDIHLRVSFDESDALKIKNGGKAIGIVRGYPDKKMALTMVHKEPFFLPKKNFTGDMFERVDTNVQEIVYSFDNSHIGAYVGQRMDVYVEAVN